MTPSLLPVHFFKMYAAVVGNNTKSLVGPILDMGVQYRWPTNSPYQSLKRIDRL